jgi:replicative superfamily II helicase
MAQRNTEHTLQKGRIKHLGVLHRSNAMERWCQSFSNAQLWKSSGVTSSETRNKNAVYLQCNASSQRIQVLKEHSDADRIPRIAVLLPEYGVRREAIHHARSALLRCSMLQQSRLRGRGSIQRRRDIPHPSHEARPYMPQGIGHWRAIGSGPQSGSLLLRCWSHNRRRGFHWRKFAQKILVRRVGP